MIAASIPQSDILYRIAVRTLAILVVGTILLYVGLLVSAVGAAVARTEVESARKELSLNILNLESEYMGKIKGIDPVLAATLGFHDVVNPRYVSSLPREALSIRE